MTKVSLGTSGNSGAGTEFQKGKPGSCRAVCPSSRRLAKKDSLRTGRT